MVFWDYFASSFHLKKKKKSILLKAPLVGVTNVVHLILSDEQTETNRVQFSSFARVPYFEELDLD